MSPSYRGVSTAVIVHMNIVLTDGQVLGGHKSQYIYIDMINLALSTVSGYPHHSD